MSQNENEFNSQVNIPFSWELKPGVSKVTHEEGNIDAKHVTANLHPHPHRLSKSARFCSNDLQDVLSPIQLQPPPGSSSAMKGNVNKQEDPFVAAEYSVNSKLSSDDKNDACKSRAKKNMFTLSCKYSCTISCGRVLKLSQYSKEKAKEEQQNDAKLTRPSVAKCNPGKVKFVMSCV